MQDRTEQRPARPGETCTCGLPATIVYLTPDFGEVPYCGQPHPARDTAPPAEAAPPACPRWCSGNHGGRVDQHRAEVGRLSKPGELALIVTIVQAGDGPSAVELSWRAADPSDTSHYLMEGIELYADEVPGIAELLAHANIIMSMDVAS